MWVVDSTLKPGTSHLYSRRTLYVDEDSWQILAVDCYDRRGQLYRVQEGHVINYYEVPNLWTTLELVMDLSNGRYLALGLQNEEPRSYDFTHQADACGLPAQCVAAAWRALTSSGTAETRVVSSGRSSRSAGWRWLCVRCGAGAASARRSIPTISPRDGGAGAAGAEVAAARHRAWPGQRMVAVGERGHVLLSDDQGRTWRQARQVPTRVLTAVCFADDEARHRRRARRMILATDDARRDLEAHALRAGSAAAFAGRVVREWRQRNRRRRLRQLLLHDQDGGASWQARRLDAQVGAARHQAGDVAGEAYPDEDLGGDPHLNRIVGRRQPPLHRRRSGHLYRSDDAGASWCELASPYDGSFFGILPLDGESLLAFGLRGHLFRSDDAGLRLESRSTPAPWRCSTMQCASGSEVVIVGLSGTMLVSTDGGPTLPRCTQQETARACRPCCRQQTGER